MSFFVHILNFTRFAWSSSFFSYFARTIFVTICSFIQLNIKKLFCTYLSKKQTKWNKQQGSCLHQREIRQASHADRRIDKYIRSGFKRIKRVLCENQGGQKLFEQLSEKFMEELRGSWGKSLKSRVRGWPEGMTLTGMCPLRSLKSRAVETGQCTWPLPICLTSCAAIPTPGLRFQLHWPFCSSYRRLSPPQKLCTCLEHFWCLRPTLEEEWSWAIH